MLEGKDGQKKSEKRVRLLDPVETHSLWRITLNFLKIAVPTIVSCLFLELILFINTVFAGHLND